MAFNATGATAGASGGSGLGGLVGGVYGLLAGDSGASKYYKKALQELLGIQLPEYDESYISPVDLQGMGDYSAQTYELPNIPGPQTVQEDPSLRSQQLESLGQFGQVAREGMPLVDRLAADQANRGITSALQGNTQATLEDLAARGMSGGAVAAAGDQRTGDYAAQIGSNLAQASQMRRLGAAGQAAGLAGDIRGQDFNRNTYNSDAINRFNQWVSQLGTQRNQFAAQARGAASDRNVGERQRMGDYNRMNQQATLEANINRKNQTRQLGFKDALARALAVSGGYNQYGQQKDLEAAARQQNVSQIGTGIGGLGGGLLGGLL